MGGVPCWVIITCGGLSAAADTLAMVDPKPATPAAKKLSTAARYLSRIESEICELGPELASFLSAEEHAAVLTAGDAAEALRARIFDHLFTAKAEKVTADELTDFAESQRAFFLDLAGRYKDK